MHPIENEYIFTFFYAPILIISPFYIMIKDDDSISSVSYLLSFELAMFTLMTVMFFVSISFKESLLLVFFVMLIPVIINIIVSNNLSLSKEYSDVEKYDEAKKFLLNQCITAIEESDSDLSKGIENFYSSQYKNAIFYLNKSIDKYPNKEISYSFRGRAKGLLGEWENAILDFNRVIEIEPNAVVYNDRGLAYLLLEKYEKAIQDFDKAIELDPNYAKAYDNRGRAKHCLKRYDEAIQDYNKAVKLDPRLKRS